MIFPMKLPVSPVCPDGWSFNMSHFFFPAPTVPSGFTKVSPVSTLKMNNIPEPLTLDQDTQVSFAKLKSH